MKRTASEPGLSVEKISYSQSYSSLNLKFSRVFCAKARPHFTNACTEPDRITHVDLALGLVFFSQINYYHG